MGDVFLAMIRDGIPALHFESKVLYPKRVINADRAYDIFDLARLGGENDFVVLTSSNQIQTDLVIICPGGLVHDAMTVARNQMIEKERETTIVVPSKLYPFDLEPIISICEKARQIVVIEEGIIGGSWGDTLVRSLYTKIWRQISNPILVIGSRDFAIPSARHLEEKVLINSTRIEELINEASYS